jgi:hypothetical protein
VKRKLEFVETCPRQRRNSSSEIEGKERKLQKAVRKAFRQCRGPTTISHDAGRVDASQQAANRSQQSPPTALGHQRRHFAEQSLSVGNSGLSAVPAEVMGSKSSEKLFLPHYD